MIELNIDLLELNDLYYAVGKHRMACEEQIKEYGDSEYFKSQLARARQLETIVQDALYNRVDELQDAIDYIDEVVERVENEEKEPEYEYGSNRIHRVSNEEADEDAGPTISYRPKATQYMRNERNGVSQFILDFVQANNVVSYTEMNDMYKAYTKGSNSFSHILKALMIPYKNRPTRRYIVNTGRGGYTVRTATMSNWVVADDKWFPGYRRPVSK